MRRTAVAVLAEPAWCPPGIDPYAWRIALADDLLDELARMVEVEPGVVVAARDADLLRQVGWPGLASYQVPVPVPQPRAIFEALAGAGFDQAALVAGDAPDLPGLHVAKLLRPLTSHPVAAAAAHGGGLVGLAAVLPAPEWLPGGTLDQLSTAELRRHAPRPADVAAGAPWHRLRGPADLARLDPRLDGWDATRALLRTGG